MEYGLLEQYLYENLRQGKLLSILPDGIRGGFLIPNNDSFIWAGDINFGVDMLLNYPILKEEILGKYLHLYITGEMVVASLEVMERIGGYDEPLESKIILKQTGYSIWEVLESMNDSLKNHNRMLVI